MDYDRIVLEMLNRIGILEEKVSALEEKRNMPETNQTDYSQGVSKKYRFLADYLHDNSEETIKLHFDELERILGFKLPNSAYAHRAFWANTTTHSVALSWLAVGYETVEVDLNNKFIVFEKKRSY
ncbi:MAG: hypothetical protein M0R40_10455 [Firmicutes bacterium]|nr:hypothetical protein [Bacillota bacterium]